MTDFTPTESVLLECAARNGFRSFMAMYRSPEGWVLCGIALAHKPAIPPVVARDGWTPYYGSLSELGEWKP